MINQWYDIMLDFIRINLPCGLAFVIRLAIPAN
jgi:hypothetical protein